MYSVYVNIVAYNCYCSHFIVMQGQRTPLHDAAEGGHTDSVALLVASGADVNMKSAVS